MIEDSTHPAGSRPGDADRYDHRVVEPHWQAVWAQTGLNETDLSGAERPFYNLMMFPYPSAEGLHVGNVYAYVGADVYGRFTAMRGFDVFEPIGFDAFGIHSENYALKQDVHPAELTARNVERFRERQLKRIGNRFDWSREVDTTDPRYYRWTQWLFLQLFKAGLAVRKRAAVNWCPRDRTVLADEQVIDGRCERCDTPVVQRELEQWFLRTTAYAQRLLDNLERLDWSENVKAAQRHWIGRSEGVELRMPVHGQADVEISVFTTRIDTVFGMTYVVLAPEHPLVEPLTAPELRDDVRRFREAAGQKSELERLVGSREKNGIFLGAYAVNPATGDQVPIWVADYVLATYGSGAVMAVPAHDERDFAFARAFDLPIRRVIAPAGGGSDAEPFTEAGVLVDSGPFTGLASADAYAGITAWLEERGIAQRSVRFRLRDWLISRQRYWGPPIPVIFCDDCGAVAVPEDQLPVLLPPVEDWKPSGTGSSPLAAIPSFVETRCPTCGGPARRETDVSDNFLDSAWYALRYLAGKRGDEQPFDPALVAKWMPVDMYVGGAEHSVLHLLYSRFVCMALHDMGLLPFEEPFARFRAHGILTLHGGKMNKSRGNVVNPDTYIERLGADTLRLYLLFIGPFEQGGDFNDRGIGGTRRFLNRVWELVLRHRGTLSADLPSGALRATLHHVISRVERDLASLHYNTAIAVLMEYLNALHDRPALHEEEAFSLVRMLAPFAPHVAEELWQRLGQPYSIHQQPFPVADPELLVRRSVPLAVQVNGRTRGVVQVAPDASQEEALAAATAQVVAFRRERGTTAAPRLVYIPGRVLNLVQ
jgi:leucyl-tRNA synthetase